MPKPKHDSSSVHTWATNLLLSAHAIVRCSEHGFMRVRPDHGLLEYAQTLAISHPYPGLSRASGVKAIDHVMDGIGDECPSCG